MNVSIYVRCSILGLCLVLVSGCETWRKREDKARLDAASTVTAKCLTRASPNGGKTITTVYTPVGGDWATTNTGVIHSGNNKAKKCKTDGEYCKVNMYDEFTVKQGLTADVFDYSRDYKSGNYSNEESSLRVGVGGFYIAGDIEWADQSTGEVFVLFTGSVECKFPSAYLEYRLPNGTLKRCDTYEIEIYPDLPEKDKKKWDEYKPNSTSTDVVWTDGECRSPSEDQPGGGGGHDPP